MVLPLLCPLCGRGVPFDGSANMFCTECLQRMPMIRGKVCRTCGAEADGILESCSECMNAPKPPWTKAYALFKYTDGVRECISPFQVSRTNGTGQAAGTSRRRSAERIGSLLRRRCSHPAALEPLPPAGLQSVGASGGRTLPMDRNPRPTAPSTKTAHAATGFPDKKRKNFKYSGRFFNFSFDSGGKA